MYVSPAFDITRLVVDDRIRTAETHRLVRLARQARKAQRASADPMPLVAEGRRPRFAPRFGH